MTTRQVNLALRAAAAVLSVGAAAAVPVGLFWPDRTPLADASVGPRATASAGGRAGAIAPLSDFQAVWVARLRRPLATPATGPATAPGDTADAPAGGDGAPPITLVGTIGDSVAMFRTADGSVEAKGVGERTGGGAEVVSIRRSRVVVRYNGRAFTLDRPPDAPATRP